MLFAPLKSFTRILSFTRKELLEVVRRPGAFFGLVLGPFLIMAVFGIGYSGVRRPLETVLVLPPESGLSQQAADYQELAGAAIHLREVTADSKAAGGSLERQEIDLLVMVPADVRERFQNGERATIRVLYNEVDPLIANYAGFVAYRLQQEVNRAILTRAVQEGEDYAVRLTGSEEFRAIPPEVVAQPTRAETANLAPTPPAVVTFFLPAVVALILQHMAVSLTSLSIVRDRLSGAMELFRVSPVGVVEVLLGKYLGFAALTAMLGAAITTLGIVGLGVPLLGPPSFLVLVSGLLVLASLGLGLLISVVADSERQAVQLSLLVLLASVFFSGLVLPLEEFHPLVRFAAHLLPITSGLRLVQDAMLRGGTYAGHLVGVLAAISLAYFILTGLLLRRAMARG
jgi:ABC-2 type transport system permease protein